MFTFLNRNKEVNLEPYGYLATIIYHDKIRPYSKQCATWTEALEFLGRYGKGNTIRVEPLYEDTDLFEIKE